MSKFSAILLAVAVATGGGALAAAHRGGQADQDSSYDQAEKNRVNGIESRSDDQSYDVVEALRMQITPSL